MERKLICSSSAVVAKRGPRSPSWSRRRANTLVSVRRVTQQNAGKRAAGVDKVLVKTPQARGRLTDTLMGFRPWRARPTRRVYIPKSNGKQRPLGIPTIMDRALQARLKNALEPEWEAKFEASSYGFRPGRSCHDAILDVWITAKRKPDVESLARFLRGQMPPTAKLVDVKSDPPVPSGGSGNTWTCNVRVTMAPVEDVLDAPDAKEEAAFLRLVAELNVLSAWGEAYTRSPYAGRYPGFTADPASYTPPKLLTVVYPAGKPLAPLYGKVEAEWQVDHWEYSVLSLGKPQNTTGKFRSEFTGGPVYVQGSPEAGRFLAQVKIGIDAARPKQAAIEAAYRSDVLKATQPGAIFRGQLRYQSKTVSAEVRLTAPPAGSDLQQEVQLELRLPDTPDESFIYLAQRAKRLPLRPTAPANADGAAPALTGQGEEPLPKGDLTLSLVAVNGKQGKFDGSVPSEFMLISRQHGQASSVTLSVRDGRLEGRLNGYSDTSAFVLSAQQSP